MSDFAHHFNPYCRFKISEYFSWHKFSIEFKSELDYNSKLSFRHFVYNLNYAAQLSGPSSPFRSAEGLQLFFLLFIHHNYQDFSILYLSFFSGAQIPLYCSSNREVVSKSHNHEKCFLRACAYLFSRHKSFAGLPPFLVFCLPSLSSTSVLQCYLCCLLYFLYGSR